MHNSKFFKEYANVLAFSDFILKSRLNTYDSKQLFLSNSKITPFTSSS